jgi:hypothetical protein
MSEDELLELAKNWLSSNSSDESWLDASSNRVKTDLGELLLKVYEQGMTDGIEAFQ